MTDKLKCSTCHEMKDTSEYYKSYTTTRGYGYNCKICSNRITREIGEKRQIARYSGAVPLVDTSVTYKLCPGCDTNWPVSNFYHSVKNKDGYFTYCKSCSNKRQKFYRGRKKEEKTNRKDFD